MLDTAHKRPQNIRRIWVHLKRLEGLFEHDYRERIGFGEVVIENIEVSKRDKLQSYRIVHIDNEKTGTSSSSSRSSEKIKGDIQRLYRELKENGYIHTVRNNKEVFMCDLEFNPITKQDKPIFTDQDGSKTMFRIVVKNNINSVMVDNLIDSFGKTLEMLDSIEFKNKNNGTFKGIHRKKNLFSKHC